MKIFFEWALRNIKNKFMVIDLLHNWRGKGEKLSDGGLFSM